MTSLRQLAAGDAAIDDVLTLIQRSFAYMEGRIDPPSSMTRLTVEAINAQCASGEVWVIGAAPRACVFLTLQDDSLYIGKLAVDQAHRGQGLARRLIDHADLRAQTLGRARLRLETRIELTENHATFQKLGFRITGEGAHDGYARPTYVTMERPVQA